MARCLAVMVLGSRILFNSSSTACKFPDSTASNHFSSSSSLFFLLRFLDISLEKSFSSISSSSSSLLTKDSAKDLLLLGICRGGLNSMDLWATFFFPKEIFNFIGGLVTCGCFIGFTGFTLGVLAFFGTAAFLGLDFLDDDPDLHLEQKNGTSSRTTH
eukprot:05123.XXX_42093_42566_1 [CDS] Oithona nana genome sequencing.